MTDQVTDAQAAAGAAAPIVDTGTANQGADTSAAGGAAPPAGAVGADAGAPPAGGKPAGDGAGIAAATGEDGKPAPARGEDGKFVKKDGDWREQVAGADAKLLERLKRFKEPADIAKAWVEADKRINSGQKPGALAKDATPEQVAEWRKANGIPETPEGYDVTSLRDGLVVGEADKPMLDEILKGAHGRNTPPEHVRGIVEDYFALRDREIADRTAKDDALVSELQPALRTEWGPHYERNLNIIEADIANLWGDDAEKFKSARLADGTPLFAHPTFVKQYFAEAFERNPQATNTGGGGGGGVSLDDEIAALEADQRKDITAYQKDPLKPKRYTELLDLRIRRDAKRA